MTDTDKALAGSGADKALKFDTDKIRMELLSVPAMREVAQVLTYGAKKYTTETNKGEHNWRKGMEWSRLFGAALRHLTAAMNGEDLDPESGLPHLAHAACCIMFLQEYRMTGAGVDDRYVRPDDSLAGYVPEQFRKIREEVLKAVSESSVPVPPQYQDIPVELDKLYAQIRELQRLYLHVSQQAATNIPDTHRLPDGSEILFGKKE